MSASARGWGVGYCTHFQNQRASKHSMAGVQIRLNGCRLQSICAQPFLLLSRSSRVLDGDESRRLAPSAALSSFHRCFGINLNQNALRSRDFTVG
jgi:hypothetical protein